MFAIGVLVFDHSLGLFGWVLPNSLGPSSQLPGPKLRDVLAVRQSIVGLWCRPPIRQHVPSALGDLDATKRKVRQGSLGHLSRAWLIN